MDEEEVDARGGAVGGQIDAAATTTAPAAATMEKPSQPSATPAAIRPALFYGGSLPRPPLHAGHPLVTPGSAPVLANGAVRGSSGVAPSASAAFGGMKQDEEGRTGRAFEGGLAFLRPLLPSIAMRRRRRLRRVQIECLTCRGRAERSKRVGRKDLKDHFVQNFSRFVAHLLSRPFFSLFRFFKPPLNKTQPAPPDRRSARSGRTRARLRQQELSAQAGATYSR